MRNIKIEEVADINFDYPYLEIFFQDSSIPFLEIGISDAKQLTFKIYSLKSDILLIKEDWEYILTIAKEFLPKALKNQDDFLNYNQD